MSDTTNYTRPEDKARWGFSGNADEIKVAPQTVGETLEEGEEVSIDAKPAAKASHKNGGGAKK